MRSGCWLGWVSEYSEVEKAWLLPRNLTSHVVTVLTQMWGTSYDSWFRAWNILALYKWVYFVFWRRKNVNICIAGSEREGGLTIESLAHWPRCGRQSPCLSSLLSSNSQDVEGGMGGWWVGGLDLQLTFLWAVITHSWTNLEKWGCGNILIENPPPPLVRERSSREICVTSNGNRAKKSNKNWSRNSRRVSINPFQLFLSSGKNRSYYHRNPFDWMWR